MSAIRRLLRSPHDRAISVLAIPALGALVADPLLSLVDTAFVGRIGREALAALGVASAIFAVAFFAFNFLEYGTTSLVARAIGAGDRRLAGRAVVLAFATSATVGILAVAVLEAAAGPITGWLGAGGAVQEKAVTYVRIRALAAPAVLAVRAGHGTYRGFQDTRTPMLITVGINCVNLILDPLFIFGFGWGIAGAAWATCIAQWVGAVWFVGLILGRHQGRLEVIPTRPDLGELRAFLRVGRDLVIRSGSLLGALTMAAAVATRVSDTAIAAHQVVMQLWLLLALGLDALAIAAQALIGLYVGERKLEVAREVADRLLVLGIGIGVGLGTLLALVGGIVPGWFSDDPEIVEAATSIWVFLAASQPLNAAVFVWDGVFIGVGDFAYLAGATAGAAVASAAVLALVLPMDWGLRGVWWGVIALLAARALTLAWRRAIPGGPLHRLPPVPGPSSPGPA